MNQTETRIEFSEFHVKWIIHNFSERNSILRSQKTKQANNNIQWNLMLNPHNKDKTHLSIFLEVTTAKQIHIEYKLTVQDIDEKDLVSLNTNFICADQSTWGFTDVLKRQDILPLKDDIMIVKCWIKMKNGINSVDLEDISCDSQKIMMNNYNNLLNNNNFSDIILESNDGTKLYAHKCILSAHSPVFASMLERNFKDRHATIKIENMDKDVLRSMLEFMYSHKLDNDVSKLNQLYLASNKFEILHLNMICEAQLCKQLTIENAAEHLILAEECKNERLKIKILEFMKKNMKRITEKNMLQILVNKSHLYNDIINFLISD